VVRDDYLGVAFCAQCSTFEQWLLVPDTLLVDVLTGFYVVYSIHYEVQACPEVIVKVLFVFLANSQFD
jgi:hypothetical protein